MAHFFCADAADSDAVSGAGIIIRPVSPSRRDPVTGAARRGLPIIADLRFAVRTDSNAAQLAMIRAGGGIGMCQVGLAARDPDLVRLLGNEIELELMTWLVMHEDLKAAPRCRVTFDALTEGLIAYRATLSGPTG